VVAAFYPIAYAADRLAPGAGIENLTPAGTEPHDLELSPRDVEKVAGADVVLYLGQGFMPALEDAVAGRDNAVDLLAGEELQAPQDGGAANDESRLDPYVWLDPVRYAAMVAHHRPDARRPHRRGQCRAGRERGRMLPAVAAVIPESVRELLATGPLGTVITTNADGTPHVTVAWAGFDGDELVMATFYNLAQRKLRNLRRDPRVAVSFLAKEHAGQGLHPYAVIEGRARISEGGALDVMDHLAQYYIGPGQRFPMRDVPEGIVVHVAIDRIYGQGPWREEAGGS
jgi:PPOX class probable F420-dependent enzyme